MILNIYTDGGCSNNQQEVNFGGWGAILEYGQAKKEIFGGEANTTNNRMEMTALVEGFKALKKEGQTIRVFSDSSYLMNCFRDKWYVKWQQNSWIGSAKKPVENQDLWKALLPYLELHNISFYRVKGHVNLDKKGLDIDALYEKFVSWNGPEFTMEDFKYITAMNNRADELANKGIDMVRGQDS